MATVLDALKGINSYPVPLRTLQETAERRGLQLDEEYTAELLEGTSFLLAKADILLWLSYAPDVSQGGQSYSFTDEQRDDMRSLAKQLMDAYEEDAEEAFPRTKYGYKGSVL